MNKLWIVLLLCILSMASVIALGDYLVVNKGSTSSVLDKDILTIDNCYNISLRARQTEGLKVTPSFKECTDNGDGYWSCDCHDTNEYHLIMRTDNSVVDDNRYYTITMTYYVYDLSKEKNSFTVRDEGNDFVTSGGNIEELGRDITVVEKIVYVNNTVYKDKIVESPPVYLDKIIRVEVDNVTKIKALQERIIELETQPKDTITITILIISIIINLALGYMLYTRR